MEGVLPVDKPAGPTSHDVVRAVRRVLEMRRVGHTGTLDPFATGLLLVVLGRATRLAEYFSALPKHYSAVMRLGAATDTDDATGTVIAASDRWRAVDTAALERAAMTQTGTIRQRPPAYSAKKVGGQRAYDAARRGEERILESVDVHVSALRITRVALPDVQLEVECSAGTYIRAIARDIGDVLGTHAHLVELRRERIGSFAVADAVPLDALDPVRIRAACIPPLEALAHLPRVAVDATAEAALSRGLAVPLAGPSPGGPVVASREGRLIAIAEVVDGMLQPRKVFADV
jgi:tRNA pseudouridine55 synthase